MSIQKIDVVNQIGGLSQAAASLIGVIDSGSATRALLKEIEKLATSLGASSASDSLLNDPQEEKAQ